MSRVTYCCEYCNMAISGAADLIAERDALRAEVEAHVKLNEPSKVTKYRAEAICLEKERDVLRAECAQWSTRNLELVQEVDEPRAELTRERESVAKLREALTNLMQAHRVVFSNRMALAFRAGKSSFVSAWKDAEQALLGTTPTNTESNTPSDTSNNTPSRADNGKEG